MTKKKEFTKSPKNHNITNIVNNCNKFFLCKLLFIQNTFVLLQSDVVILKIQNRSNGYR